MAILQLIDIKRRILGVLEVLCRSGTLATASKRAVGYDDLRVQISFDRVRRAGRRP
jgi:hypothetical protein